MHDDQNKADVLRTALAFTYSISYIYHRATALAELIPKLPEVEREGVVEQLLELLGMPLDVGLKAHVLPDLAVHVPEHRKDLVTAMIVDAARAVLPITFGFGSFTIRRLLPFVPANQRNEFLDQALARAAKENDPYFRCVELGNFAEFLSGQRKSEVLSQIVASARAVPNEEARARAFAEAAEFSSTESDARSLIREALEIAGAVADDYKRTILLIEIASHLPDAPESRAALHQARDSAMRLAQHHPQGAHLLTRLAAHLPDHRAELVARAFEVAEAMPDLDARGQAFAGLAKDLSGAQRLTALRCILERCSRMPRGNALDALATVAPILAQEGGDSLVLSTIEAIQRVAEWWP